VTKPLVVTVQSQTGQPYPHLPVYAFDGANYTGYSGTTDTNGQVTFILPEGIYDFRADYSPQGSGAGGVPCWSSDQNDCTVPGCPTVTVMLPGGLTTKTLTINHTYDPLGRRTDLPPRG